MLFEWNMVVVVFGRLVLAFLAAHGLTVFYARSFEWSDFALTQHMHPKTWARYYYSSSSNSVVQEERVPVFPLLMRILAATNARKAMACFVTIVPCLSGLVSARMGASLTVLFALPQLYRFQKGQDLRIVLGPLTPILAVNNLVAATTTTNEPGLLVPSTAASLMVSILAFVVLRPDNTAVLDVILGHISILVSFFLRQSKQGKTTVNDDNSNDKDDDNNKEVVTETTLVSSHCHQEWKVGPRYRRRFHGILAAINTVLAALTALSP